MNSINLNHALYWRDLILLSFGENMYSESVTVTFESRDRLYSDAVTRSEANLITQRIPPTFCWNLFPIKM